MGGKGDGVLWRYRGNDDDVEVYHPTASEGDVLVTLGYCFRFVPPEKARRMAKALKRAAKAGKAIRDRREAERQAAGLPSGPYVATNGSAAVVELVQPGTWAPRSE